MRAETANRCTAISVRRANMRRAWMLRGRADNRGRVVVEQTMGLMMMMRMMLTVMMVGDVQRASE